jgi:predicted methyltransferase
MEHSESSIEELADDVTIGLLKRIVEARKCTREELENIPEVVEESQKIIDSLEKNGLIERDQERVSITEKGEKILKILNQLNELMNTNQ